MANRRNKPEDIWKKIEQRGADECWPWIASHSKGYGAFRYGDKQYKAHRVIYAITNGGIDWSAPDSNYAKGFVLHTCDNSLCCNPKHLYLGDIWDNMRDKVERKRQSRLRTTAVFTLEQAATIRSELNEGKTRRELAEKYGVAYSVIKDIKRGRTYNVSSE